MNAKIGVAILVVACLGFAAGLVVLKHQAEAQQARNVSTILDFSNQIAKASANIEDLSQANLKLSSDLATNRLVAQEFSNRLAETSGTLANTEASLNQAQQQITNLNDHIVNLEAENETLDQRANALSNTIAGLDTQIAETRKKLATSETNNAFLDAQLKRQIAQRAGLERQFSDLKTVRAQLHKLQYEMIAARNLKWMREGLNPSKPMKGATLLMQRSLPVPQTGPPTPAPAYNLNVEVGSDGSVHVIPPLTAAPAQTNTPAR